MANEQESRGTDSKPAIRDDHARDRAEADRRHQAAADFRQLSQAERLADRRLNVAAKNLAVVSAAIDHKYGELTPQARWMRAAAIEAVARSLEQGRAMKVPRLKERERDRDEAQNRAVADRGSREMDR